MFISPSPRPRSSTRPASDAAVLLILLAGTFMASLDVAIVNVAAPQIQADLGVSGGSLQLVVSGYTVAYAALLITGARLGDDRGHRRVFLGGLAAFTAASMLAGLAWSGPVLIAARIAQGVAAAAMAPQVVTVIQLRYQGDARARALALFATVISLGVVAGQVLGGALVTADLGGQSWRPIFLVNVPLGVALLAAGRRLLPHTRIDNARQLDLPGVGLLTGAVVLVIAPLVFGREAGWPWWTWACLATTVPLTAVLVVHLIRVRARGGDPLVDLRLLRRAPVMVGLLAVSAQMVAYGGFLFSLSLHLQQQLGHSPLRAGLTFGPYALAFALTSLAVPRLPKGYQHPLSVLGLFTMAAGYGTLAVAARDGDWSNAVMIPLLALSGAGFGAGYSQVLTRTVADVPPHNARDASGLLTTTNQLSFALGVATIGTLYLAEVATARQTGQPVAAAIAVASGLGVVAAVLVALLGHLKRARREGLPNPQAWTPEGARTAAAP